MTVGFSLFCYKPNRFSDFFSFFFGFFFIKVYHKRKFVYICKVKQLKTRKNENNYLFITSTKIRQNNKNLCKRFNHSLQCRIVE